MGVWRWLLLAAAPACAQLPTCQVALWTTCDLEFALEASDDLARAELRAEFRSPHRDTKNIRAFREGRSLVLRFSPDEVGTWDYRVTSNLRRLDQKIGEVTATPSDAPGFVRVANMHHFQTANLQPHLWMASAIDRFSALPRAEFDFLLEARAAEKFSHIRVTIDPLTDMREAAARVRSINARGLVADLALDGLPSNPSERDRFVTDAVARFSAFNMTWAGAPAFERLPNARITLRDVGNMIAQLDPYKHPRTTLADATSSPLWDDRWMHLLSYGTPDPNIGAVEHQFYQAPAINTGIRTRYDLWNATMNGQYPASGSGAIFQHWFDLVSESRYWELEPYFDVDGGRAVALPGVEYLVYVERPGPVEIVVEDHGYDVLWMQPATGRRVPAKGYKGKRFAGVPPDNELDWVLRISREGTKEGMLKSYKFESRRVAVQQIESDPKKTPFEIDKPSGDISARLPPAYELKVLRPTRATRELLVLWVAESAAGEGGRVVGTGTKGTLRIPEALATRIPGVLSMRVMILNANGKAYEVDRAFKVVP